MAITFDINKSPIRGIPNGTLTMGWKAQAITASASDITMDGQYPGYCVFDGTGTVTALPYGNDDAATITITVSGHLLVEGRIRRVTAMTGVTGIAWFL